MKLVRFWWNLLNVAVFDSTVKPAKRIELVHYENEHAWTLSERRRRCSLSIHPRFISRTLFLSILVHEMVHVWEYQKYASMTHGKRFYSWAEQIKLTTTLTLNKEIDENDYQ